MRFFSLPLVASILSLGCAAPQGDSIPIAAADLDAEIEVIATSEDRAEVMEAYRVVFAGGRPAIDAWREHLNDQRTICGTRSTRSLNGGTVTIAQQAFWAIQDMIEETRLPLTHTSYYVLNESNVIDWLDERPGVGLIGLRIDAASASLQLAKADFDLTQSNESQQAINDYRELLASLRSQQE